MKKEDYKFPVFDDNRIRVLQGYFNEIWQLNPLGNEDQAWYMFKRAEEVRNIPGEILKDKYTEYVNYITPFQNTKYTKSDKILLSLAEYITKELYNQSFKNAIKPNLIRDGYLYGQ